MIVLGVETSTEVCGVSLVSDDGLQVERSVVEAHIHSEKLLTLIQDVFREANVEMQDVEAVAVSIGPGSFTGLRIGLSSAKGLCYALGKPLVAIPTFEAIAESVRRSGSQAPYLVIAIDAKRGDYYSATFRNNHGRFEREGGIEVLAAEQLHGRLRGLGSALVITDRKEELQQQVGNAFQWGELVEHCRAASVAQLGLGKCRVQEFADLASVEPMYLKDFVVLERKSSKK